MKKKTALILVISILLLLSGLFFINEYFKFLPLLNIGIFEEKFNSEMVMEFDLDLSEESSRYACINGMRSGEYFYCFDKSLENFEDASYIANHLDISSLPEGFLLFSISNNQIKLVNDSSESIYSNWSEYISANEEGLFFNQPEDKVLVSISEYIPWKLVEYRSSKTAISDLVELIDSLENRSTITLTRLSIDIKEELCAIEGISCSFFEGEYTDLIGIVRSYSSIDYSDIDIYSRENLSKLYVLSMVLSSVSEEDIYWDEYQEFKDKIETTYGFTDEQIMFISDYIPWQLIGYWEALYEGFNNDEINANYGYLIDLFCDEGSCIKNKVNLLYKNYEN